MKFHTPACRFSIFSLALYLLFARPAVAQIPGQADLDSTFRQVFSLNGSGGLIRGKILFLAEAPAEKIVVAGNFDLVGNSRRSSLVRLNKDGSVDESFNPAIQVLFPTGLIVQADGRIILAASNLTGSGYQASAGLIRLNADGSLDHRYDFGTGGIPAPTPMALQSDGKLLVGIIPLTTISPAHFVTRFNQDGSVDSGFQTSLPEAPKQILSQPDGGIVLRFGGIDATTFIGGSFNGRVTRLRADGSNDPDFKTFSSSIGPIAPEPGNRVVVPYSCFNLIGSSIWQTAALANRNGNTGIAPYPCSIASWDSNPVGPYVVLSDRTVFSPGSGVAQARMTNALLQTIRTEIDQFGTTAMLRESDGGIVIAGNGVMIRAKFPSPTLPTSPFLAVTSAANFKPEVAAGSLVAVFGKGLSASTMQAKTPSTTLGDSKAILISADGQEKEMTMLFVSDGQINAQIPDSFPVGQTTLLAMREGQAIGSTRINVRKVAPGIFTASGTGKGYAAAQVLRIRADGSRSYEPVTSRDAAGQIIPNPIDLGPEGELVYLVLYGTGLRQHSATWTAPGEAVKAEISLPAATISAAVLYAGEAPGLIGVDQINLLIPRSLKGVNGDVTFQLTVDGLPTQAIVRIQ